LSHVSSPCVFYFISSQQNNELILAQPFSPAALPILHHF